MSVSKSIQHIEKKGQISEMTNPQLKNTAASTTANSIERAKQIIGSAPRPVDPVVAHLKEKRRQENEEKERLIREKKGLPPKTPKPTKSSTRSKSLPKHALQLCKVSCKPPIQCGSSISMKSQSKKMNFNELMRKASSIDTTKLSITLKNKPKQCPSPQNQAIQPSRCNQTQGTQLKHSNSKSLCNSTPKDTILQLHKFTRAPLPIRQPSSQVKQMLSFDSRLSNRTSHKLSKPQDSELLDSEDDMRSFIVSSEEEELARGSRSLSRDAPEYDREEIWAIFNRGKKRSYYQDRVADEDSDDMEATGAEILREEHESRRKAELEDKREMEQEARLKEMKRKRKQVQQ